jgi:DNA-directed RNA polymerase specialized sigma24 family protein
MIGDSTPDPETAAIRHRNAEVAALVLEALPEKHREVLIRYYVHGQHREMIQAELGLTSFEFSVIHSTAKAALTTRLQRRPDQDLPKEPGLSKR